MLGFRGKIIMSKKTMNREEIKNVLDFCYLPNSFFEDLELKEFGTEQCLPGKIVPIAQKDYFLFHYIVKGKGVFKVGDKCFRLRQNDLFCIFRDQKIEYMADEEDPWAYIWIGFSGKKVLELLHLVGLWEDCPISKKVGREVANCFLQINEAMESSGIANLKVYSLFYLLLYNLQEQNHISANMLSQQEIWVRKACVYIYHNSNLPITVKDVAKAIDLNANYLSGLFKKVIGITIKDYITQNRMICAKDLLRKSDYKIKEVAKYVGYNDPVNFVKAFKKQVGKTPEEYRRQSLAGRTE